MKKRFLSLLLALALVLSLLPAAAMAAEAEAPAPRVTEEVREDEPDPGEVPESPSESSDPQAEESAAKLLRLTVSTGYSETDLTAALLTSTDNENGVPVFDPAKTDYDLTWKNLVDTTNQLRFWYQTEEAGTAVTLSWGEGGDQRKELSTASDSGTSFSNKWANCLMPGANSLTLTVTPPEDSDKTEGVYTFKVNVNPTLTALSFSAGDSALYLDQNFVYNQYEYTMDLPSTVQNVTVTATPRQEGYTLTYNSGSDSTVDVSAAESVTTTVSVGDVTTEYKVTLKKVAPFTASVTATPNDALVVLYDTQNNELAKGLGSATATDIIGGTYTVTKYGYVAQTGTLTGTPQTVELTQAPAPAKALPDYTGDWVWFRGNQENMGITNAPTPISKETALLKWSQKLGSGWSAAPTPPIVLDDALYTASGNVVYRLNKTTGAVEAQSEPMAGDVGFAMNPIAYGDGMIFVPINNGRIQALRADTLESVWISEAIGGQTVTVVTYYNGYLYTGTWNSETSVGSYFCLSATDEDPEQTGEVKHVTWRLDHMGGFYWAGAYATDKYVIFGSDDGIREGENGNGTLYSVNPQTGAVIDKIENIAGDIRSAVAYDKDTGCVYCSTKGGLFIKVKVNADGKFDHDSYKTIELNGMATGTPLVYKSVAFIGVAGPSQFSPTGHSYKIVDVNEMKVLKSIDTIPGYVQTSALLSTAYEADTNKVYAYLTYNYTPGGIYVIEYDTKTGESSAYDLFTPAGSLAQYCVCSLVCDKDGTIYYKNDSGCIMAVSANFAYLTGLKADTGKGLEGFSAGTAEYELVVPAGTKSVTFTATAPEGAEVALNGGKDMTVALEEGTAEAVFTVTAGEDTRTYTVNIREVKNDAALSDLKVNESNGYNFFKTLTPEFTADGLYYVWFGVSADRKFVNVWPELSDANASFKVIPVYNVDGESSEQTEDGSLDPTSTTNGHDRYAVYFEDDTKPLMIRVDVTAEDGIAKRSYTLLATKDTAGSYAGGVTLDQTSLSLTEGETGTLTATVVKLGDGQLDETVTWTSSAPTVAEVDQTGKVTALSAGEAVITAALDSELGTFSASCAVTVTKKDEPTPPTPPVQQDITVTFRLIGSTLSDEDVDVGEGKGNYTYQTWITTKSYTMPADSTVYDLFTKALEDAGLRSIGADRNYVETIYAPAVLGGYELSEFTNGQRSGWMYTVNDVHVGYGLKEQKLSDGDRILWHYVNDYAYEVKDWFNDPNYPPMGNENTWVDWNSVPDTAPAAPSPVNPQQPGGASLAEPDSGSALTPSVTPDASGEAKAEIPAADVTGAITAAKSSGAGAVIVAPEVKGEADKVTVELPTASVGDIAEAGLALTVRTGMGSVTLPSEALSELASKTGGAVSVSVEEKKDEAGKATGETAVEIKVGNTTVDKLSGGLKASLPAARDGVLVIVDKDGNETVVKKSAVDGGTVYALLEGSCTVKLVDSHKKFEDVTDAAWYAGAVDFAASHELFNGTGDAAFSPESSVTRSMLATVLWRLENEARAGAPETFSDVEDSWYTEGVAWASANGIVTGYGDGTFGPQDDITREQLAVMLYRYAKCVKMDVSGSGSLERFADSGKVSGYAQEALEWAVAKGLVNGRDGGVLDPAGSASRAEVAAVLQRLIQLMVK